MSDDQSARMSLEEELQRIYDSEINLEISWFYDGGIEVELGDPLNGYLAQTTVSSAADILPWLQRAIVRHFPTSEYAIGLGTNAPAPLEPETNLPSSCSYKCPSCGEMNTFPGWSEMFAFICKSCGEPVTVEPTVQ